MGHREQTTRYHNRIKIVFAIVIVCCCVGETYRFLRSMESRKPTLKRWLPYAAELGQDNQLYVRHPDYLYPPIFLILMRPLTLIPPVCAAVVWQVSKYAAIWFIFTMCWGLVGRPHPPPLWAKALAVIVSLRFILSDLGHGNINLFICLLVVLGAWLMARRWRFAAGFVVALATCIKVTPALWIVYLIYKRQWRAGLGVFVGLVLALEVVPSLFLSSQLNHALLGSWYERVISPFVSEGSVYSPNMNQSMAAVTNRLLGRSEWAPEEKPIAVVELDDKTVQWVQRALAAALLLMLGWSCRGRMPDSDQLAFAAEWAMIAPVTLALSGLTWTGHFCILILGIVVLLAFLANPQRRQTDRLARGLIIAAFALFLLTTDVITPAGRKWASGVGLPLLGALLTAAALAVMRHRCRRQEEGRTANGDTHDLQ